MRNGEGEDSVAQSCEPSGPSANVAQSKGDSSDEVSLEYSGTIVWEKPLSASFGRGVSRSQSSGIRHMANAEERGSRGAANEWMISNGESLSTKCTLRAETNSTEVKMEIVSIRFEGCTQSSSPQVGFTLQSSQNRDDRSFIYQSIFDDSCRILSAGSTFSVAYTARALVEEAVKGSSVIAPLGALLVDWTPAPLDLPFEVDRTGMFGSLSGHGPLALDHPSTIRFTGPRCHFERTPIETELLELPAYPHVAVPFEVRFRLKNNTTRHHVLTVRVSDQVPTSRDEGTLPNGLLVSGVINGQFSFAPGECQFLSYTVLATRPGKTELPSLMISSPRFRTWVVDEASSKSFQMYIFP